ncbi:MAG: ribosome small subunit-dependent GTPase A [Peptostreptococcales bacterium]
MIDGRITKGIGGFYYVETEEGILECKARGLFRLKNLIPTVGDLVSVEKKNDKEGTIVDIKERKNYLIRPPVANVELAVIVFSLLKPEPNIYLLDRFIAAIEKEELDIVLCFNKSDIASEEQKRIIKIYEDIGFPVVVTSAETGEGIRGLKELIRGKISVFAGPSGVGKSSLLNELENSLNLKTGEISDKLNRGKHTTRHVELLKLDSGGYVLDTPGFTSFEITDIDEKMLQFYFPEFTSFIGRCKFNGCFHMNEPDCRIKEAVEMKNIHPSRYKSYYSMMDEIIEYRRQMYD